MAESRDPSQRAADLEALLSATVPVTVLSKITGEVFGIRRLQQLAEADVIKKTGHGEYLLWNNIPALFKHLASTKRMWSEGEVENAEALEMTLLEQQIRVTEERANKLSMDNARLRRESVPVGEVSVFLTGFLGTLQDQLFNLTTRVAPAMKHAATIGNAEEILRSEINQLLNDLYSASFDYQTQLDETPERGAVEDLGEESDEPEASA